MSRVRFARPIAGQSFDRLPRVVRNYFNDRFDVLAQDPRTRTPTVNIHQLWGYQNVWALCRGKEWRAMYAMDGMEVVFIIFGPHETVYVDLHSLHPPDGRYLSSQA
ncbi:MAG: hypothetical protein KGJ23_05795 [Euryarchaeota archaeon]|nr:hypothetical protein [Euryarchaeota archaeon]MDE1836111.1 hypothetical protein [Euryarchaeota archaeon]MDE1879401.1 hypothetical protein [Euryarchaeota archaeon]MDE2044089.1 hypothetical protein [Thermoplasmata archaeon]